MELHSPRAALRLHLQGNRLESHSCRLTVAGQSLIVRPPACQGWSASDPIETPFSGSLGMASPFRVFRKHQKVLIATLGILAMVAFVFLVPLMSLLGGGRGSGGPVNPVIISWDGE